MPAPTTTTSIWGMGATRGEKADDRDEIDADSTQPAGPREPRSSERIAH
jgi:hypothetical protein